MMIDNCIPSNNNNKRKFENLLFCVNKTKCEISNKNFQARQIVLCFDVWLRYESFQIFRF